MFKLYLSVKLYIAKAIEFCVSINSYFYIKGDILDVTHKKHTCQIFKIRIESSVAFSVIASFFLTQVK
jgi:hypothetical protein